MKGIKTFFKSIVVAFSMYSKIPMPRFNWGSDDMKYHLCFFPWVGAFIGAIEFLGFFLFKKFGLDSILFYLLAIALPIIVTGGFHIDGYMDTMDAVHSYQNKEKKLEILKDPHIGAFSVIMIILYFLVAIAFAFQIRACYGAVVIAFSFFNSRCLSGISVLCFPKAKKNGMAYTESETGSKKIVFVSLIIQFLFSNILLFYFIWPKYIYGIVSIVSFLLCYIHYYCMSKKNFGGITGDLSGYFVVFSELINLICISMCDIVFGV